MKRFLPNGWSCLAFALVICGCDQKQRQTASALTHGGNPDAGRHEIEYYGCASCHIVPGVAGAQGLIGPSLQGVENRNYIGGVVQNSPDKLIRWIQNAPSLNPKTAMPDLEIPDQPARDIGAISTRCSDAHFRRLANQMWLSGNSRRPAAHHKNKSNQTRQYSQSRA